MATWVSEEQRKKIDKETEQYVLKTLSGQVDFLTREDERERHYHRRPRHEQEIRELENKIYDMVHTRPWNEWQEEKKERMLKELDNVAKAQRKCGSIDDDLQK